MFFLFISLGFFWTYPNSKLPTLSPLLQVRSKQWVLLSLLQLHGQEEKGQQGDSLQGRGTPQGGTGIYIPLDQKSKKKVLKKGLKKVTELKKVLKKVLELKELLKKINSLKKELKKSDELKKRTQKKNSKK